ICQSVTATIKTLINSQHVFPFIISGSRCTMIEVEPELPHRFVSARPAVESGIPVIVLQHTLTAINKQLNRRCHWNSVGLVEHALAVWEGSWGDCPICIEAITYRRQEEIWRW